MTELIFMTYEQARAEHFKTLKNESKRKMNYWAARVYRSRPNNLNDPAHIKASEYGAEYSYYKDALEALENQPKWISVEERLPEDGVQVLVHAVGENTGSVIAMTAYTHNMHGYDIEGWQSPWLYFFRNYEITHWMPLPAPPKEEYQMNKPPIMEANAREIHIIEFLAGLDCQIQNGQEILRERLKLIPNGWRDFRLAVTATQRVLDAVYDTLPPKTLRHMDRLCSCGEVVIRPKPAIKLPDDVQIVCNEDLRLLINAAIAAECAVCLKDAKAQKKCRLRKALNNIAPTEALRADGLCSYTDVVTDNELGKYI